MDFLKQAAKRRSAVSWVAYYGLNICLALAVLLLSITIESPTPAFVLVILSKWRVLAVRPRYWWANILANMVDLVVSLSFVYLLSLANTGPEFFAGIGAAHLILTFFYIVWLIWLKPRSRQSAVNTQAGIALFVGTTTIFLAGYNWPLAVVVIMGWVLGFVTAKHSLTTIDDSNPRLYVLLWSLMAAELFWLGYHWTKAYAVPYSGDIFLPQIAFIVTLFGFIGERMYAHYIIKKTSKKQWSQKIIMPILFAVSTVIILLVVFNGIDTNTLQ